MLIFSIRNLLSRPMRSLLALLGLSVAIAGMVGLFAVAEGLDDMVDLTFGRVTGLVVMQPAAPMPIFSRLPAEWESEIAAVPGVTSVNAEVWQRVNLIEEKMILSPPRFLFGTNIATRLEIEHAVYADDIVEGRFLTLDDRGTSNCLISRPIAEEFDVTIGDTLTVEGADLNIVGIYHCQSLLLDVAIILDIERVREITSFGPEFVSAYYLEHDGQASDEQIAQRIEDAFRGRRREVWQPGELGTAAGRSPRNAISEFFKALDRSLKSATLSQGAAQPDDEQTLASAAVDGSATLTETSDVAAAPAAAKQPTSAEPALEVRSALEWGEKFDDFSADLNLFLTIMTSIGVIIAVLSIVNTMLMSVTERIIEFGILKANGWSRRDVVRLITCESAILGIGGGLLGCGIGWGATHVVNWYWPDRIYLYASPMLLGFSILFSIVLGIVGGLYPAFWAMRMMPMDAIRRG
jgi:putative ABC transport system permease protein